MGRWTGSWLAGPGSAGSGPAVDGHWRGQRLALPRAGPGAVAGWGRRAAAYLCDAVGSYLVAALFVRSGTPRNWSLLVFAVEYVVLLAVAGQSAGMRVVGLRVARLDGRPALGLWRAVVRTALLVLLVPVLIYDRDGRGVHDRSVGTVVLRS